MTSEQTIIAIFIFAVEIATTVAGQLLLKHAMEGSRSTRFNNPRILKLFVAGVASLAIAFFLTIGLLQHFDLSKFYPIQGSTIIIIALAAAVFLREKLTPQLIVGTILISLGIAIVSLT